MREVWKWGMGSGLMVRIIRTVRELEEWVVA
jgi:hypothetical protein